jgi:hypothetical protein
MGLLDDAIREHLELKRRRGADPDEVAREQREALNAAAERKLTNAGGDDAELGAEPVRTAVDAPEIDRDSTPAAEDRAGEPPPVQTAQAAGADETAELDMSSVLGDGDDAEAPSAPPAEADADEQPRASTPPVPAGPPTQGDSPEEDSLEWEVPGEAAKEEALEPAEDVLEETPDFLLDTPEQDRLWFEQRPPRDFDFDK